MFTYLLGETEQATSSNYICYCQNKSNKNMKGKGEAS